MSQPQGPSLESFFGGGGKSISWKDVPIGTTVSGTITAIHPAEPQTDLVTKAPVIDKRTGQPKMQVRIGLATTLRDPQDPEDDGQRTLFVKGWMRGAIGDAVRKAGASMPEVGGQLTVQLIRRDPPDTPGLNPTNIFAAQYVPPAAASAGQFFNGQAQQQAPVQQQVPQQQYIAPQQQPVPQQAPVQQPVQQQVPQQQYVAPQQQPVGPEPQRPEAISEQAWNAMDPATRAQTAQIFANVPPF